MINSTQSHIQFILLNNDFSVGTSIFLDIGDCLGATNVGIIISIISWLMDVVILKCLMTFPTSFQLYHGGQCTYPYFSWVSTTCICFHTMFFASHQRLAKKVIHKTMISDDRGINLVTMTIIISLNTGGAKQ